MRRCIRWAYEWWETRRVLRDPLSRETLLGDNRPEDYADAPRHVNAR